MQIKYVGVKPSKTDNVAGTRLTWLPGQVHEVDVVAAAKLLKHPDIWAEFDLKAAEADARANVERLEAEAAAAKAEVERLRLEAELAEKEAQVAAARAAEEAAEKEDAEKAAAEAAAKTQAQQAMTVEQVREALAKKGINFHPNTGEQKLRAKLAEVA